MKDQTPSCWTHSSFPLKSGKPRTTWKYVLSSRIPTSLLTDAFVKLGTLWKIIREHNLYRPWGAYTKKWENQTNLYLLFEHIKYLTGVPPVTTNHKSNKQHETGFWITRFRGRFCYQHVKTADSYEKLSPLNICSLNWSFRRGSNNWRCLQRCHRTTTRTIRVSSYITWLPNKRGLLRWILPKKDKPEPLNLSHTSSLDVSFTSASQKKLCMPQLQPYSLTMSALSHLAELDAPCHNN